MGNCAYFASMFERVAAEGCCCWAEVSRATSFFCAGQMEGLRADVTRKELAMQNSEDLVSALTKTDLIG